MNDNTFSTKTLTDKLFVLNISQNSINSLSRWCISHRNNAKDVVETWNRKFYCSPRQQRLCFLYLANDILQNSRQAGPEYLTEFLKVLPMALRDVLENGDEFGRNAARRLIKVWVDRTVFGSKTPRLNGVLTEINMHGSKRDGKAENFVQLVNTKVEKRKHAANELDKVNSAYQVVYGGPVDEDVALSKCRNAIIGISREIDIDRRSGQLSVERVKGHHAMLLDSIQQLGLLKFSRTNLVSILKETLHQQEIGLSNVCQQLKAAESESQNAQNLCRKFQNDVKSQGESYIVAKSSRGVGVAQPSPLSLSSATMPSNIQPSFNMDVVTASKESSSDHRQPGKRHKLEINGEYAYIASQIPQPPVVPFFQSFQYPDEEQPPLPLSSPPMPPPPPPPPAQTYPDSGVLHGKATATHARRHRLAYSSVGSNTLTMVSQSEAPPTFSYSSSSKMEDVFSGQQPHFPCTSVSYTPLPRQP